MALAGCGSGSSGAGDTFHPQSSASATASRSASAVASSPAATPLTGQPVAATADAARVAVAVTVRASSGDPAPVGLGSADVVYQEFNNPGSARYVAVFQSHAAASVGPVGETEPVDGQVLGVYRALVANAGGTKGFVQTLDHAPIHDLSSANASSAYTPGAGGALYTSTARLLALAPRGTTAPPPIFSFAAATAGAPAGGRPATRVTITAPDHTAQVWTYSSATHRWATTLPGGAAMSVANLVVQNVPYITPGSRHASVQSARSYGHGTCTVLTRGAAVTGQWFKPGATSITNYADTHGVPVAMTPGPTWIALAPTGTTVEAVQ